MRDTAGTMACMFRLTGPLGPLMANTHEGGFVSAMHSMHVAICPVEHAHDEYNTYVLSLALRMAQASMIIMSASACTDCLCCRFAIP